MKCKKCGNELMLSDGFCNKCGTKVKKFEFNILYVLVPLTIITILVVTLLIINKNRSIEETAKKLEMNDEGITFEIGEDTFKLGENVKVFLDKGYTYNTHQETIYSDMIGLATFKKDNKEVFLAALYCPLNEDCQIEDTNLVKINFYTNSKVKINGQINFSMNLNGVKKVLGENNGVFYQDSNLLVWSNGNDVGDEYYIISFDTGGLFSLGYIRELRIGKWWYEGESKYTMVKEESKDEEK